MFQNLGMNNNNNKFINESIPDGGMNSFINENMADNEVSNFINEDMTDDDEQILLMDK